MPSLCVLTISFAAALLYINQTQSQEQFQVLDISNIPFPNSPTSAATAKPTYKKDVVDFTVCYRSLIDSYNDGNVRPFFADPYYFCVYEAPGKGRGWGSEGYPGGVTMLQFPWVGPDLSKRRFPIYHHFNFARNIEIGNWNHFCTSYSSNLKRIHMFQNGVKTYSFQYTDGKDYPTAPKLFQSIKIGKYMRGLETSFHPTLRRTRWYHIL
jgi:hypothetical protein